MFLLDSQPKQETITGWKKESRQDWPAWFQHDDSKPRATFNPVKPFGEHHKTHLLISDWIIHPQLQCTALQSGLSKSPRLHFSFMLSIYHPVTIGDHDKKGELTRSGIIFTHKMYKKGRVHRTTIIPCNTQTTQTYSSSPLNLVNSQDEQSHMVYIEKHVIRSSVREQAQTRGMKCEPGRV